MNSHESTSESKSPVHAMIVQRVQEVFGPPYRILPVDPYRADMDATVVVVIGPAVMDKAPTVAISVSGLEELQNRTAFRLQDLIDHRVADAFEKLKALEAKGPPQAA